MNAYDIIIKPVLTEKAYDGIANKKYCFYVDVNATKTEVKNAIEKIFEVEVESVNIANVRGKKKRERGTVGVTAARRKAYVQLTEKSKTIPFFDSLG
ncbi:MAG: 50S ribosomal protein L23 [Clostridia bacterium]|nr:50S ribosomal protein L23 [Clostridia bacterium]